MRGVEVFRDNIVMVGIYLLRRGLERVRSLCWGWGLLRKLEAG